MAVRYFIKYFDVVDIEHKLNIYDDNYVGEALQVDGSIILTYSETDDNLEAIRGQGLNVELEANTNLTFNDLWSEEEKTFKVDYKRNDVLLFEGWLNPEGFFENYVDTNWLVSFDCVDGLGYLKDLSFVDNSGFPITGRKKYIEVLSLALRRTELYLKINTSVNIIYNGLSETLDILDNVYANTERYIKDDGETIMSCDEVIRDILEPFGACLTYFNGSWYIYKPNELYSNTSVNFNVYNYLGVNQFQLINLNLSSTIGSNFYNADIFHCSGNQQIKNTSSIGAYRINYKYGVSQALNTNKSLYSNDGITIDGWDILNSTTFDPLTIGGYGVLFNNANSKAGDPRFDSIINTTPVILEGDNLAKIITKWDVINDHPISLNAIYKVVICDMPINDPGVSKYYLNGFYMDWVTYDTAQVDAISYFTTSVFSELEIPAKPAAITGDAYLYVIITTPLHLTTDALETSGKSLLNEVAFAPVLIGEASNLKGEFHTSQRANKPSSKVKEIKEVATGDNISDIYEGTVYKNDSSTPTTLWNRKGVVESKPLLRVMGEETMRMSQLPARIFSGDVFGFYNYLSVITIHGLDGLFMPIKYNYNTKSNIINAELKQIYGDEVADISYKLTYDYGNTVKPTITG